jgi:fatty-acyl-CoA synthase
MFERHFAHWPPGLPRTLPVPQTPLHYNLEVTAARYPDRACTIFYDTPLTYRELKREVDALAGYLQQACGVAKGDRVLLFLQNSPQFMIGFYAILRADAVVVPVNPMNLAEELAHLVADSHAQTAIVGQELLGAILPLLGRTALRRIVVAAYADHVRRETDLRLPPAVAARAAPVTHAGCVSWREAVGAALAPRDTTADPGDLAVMPYTSGTTGRPKGCMHTHANVMSTAVGGQAWFGATPGTVLLVSLPMFHVTAMQAGLNGPLYTGGTCVVMQRWDRELAARLIERHRVAAWAAISTMVIDFLANPDLGRHDLSSLNRLNGGGAAMPEAVAKKLTDVTGLAYVEGYGLTETMAPSHINPPHRPKRQCLGIPIFGVDARILDPGTSRELGPGEVGEIVTHGPQVFQGYWKNERATREAFVEIDGKRFFRTGDLARYDEDGYFFLVDRLKRMINAAGMKVWPAEVEAMMHAHPDILEACIIAAQDERRGETVKAVVALKPERRGQLGAADIVAWCREHMAAYKVPRIVEFVDSLPKSGTGKVMWRALQEKETSGSR